MESFSVIAYTLLKASCWSSLPSQAVMSRSSSAQEMGSGTSMSETALCFFVASVGVTKEKVPSAMTASGRAFMNSKMPLAELWCSPKVS